MAAVLARYDGQVEKNMKCKVQARKDNEYLKELRRVRRQQYKDKHRDEHRDRDRLMEETTNDEDISKDQCLNLETQLDEQINQYMHKKCRKKKNLDEEERNLNPDSSSINIALYHQAGNVTDLEVTLKKNPYKEERER